MARWLSKPPESSIGGPPSPGQQRPAVQDLAYLLQSPTDERGMRLLLVISAPSPIEGQAIEDLR
jgi:hypothetical protein